MSAIITRAFLVVHPKVPGVSSVVAVAVVAVVARPLPAAGRSTSAAVALSRVPRAHIILGCLRNSASMSAGSVNITAFFRARQGRCLYDFPLIRTVSRRCHADALLLLGVETASVRCCDLRWKLLLSLLLPLPPP